MQEAFSLLLFWSLLVNNEGEIRFVGSIPSDLGRSDKYPPCLEFFGGLAEVIFGLVGVFIGYSAFIPRYYSTLVTKLGMVVQSLLGWFVFITYVFARPIVEEIQGREEGILGMSIPSTKLVLVMGILTSFHFCLALQGGQFIFLARLICAATGDDFLKQKSGHFMRAVFWNLNLAGSGLWTLITGAVVRSRAGAGKFDTPFASPPNVGTLPSITIVMGLIIICWGLVGVGMAFSKAAPTAYFVVTGLVYVAMLLNYGILQFGFFADGGAGGPVAMHNGLVFMIVFLGPYFVLKNARGDDEEA